MNITSDEGPSSFIKQAFLPASIQFWLILLSEIPSTTCSLFLLYHFIMDSEIRRSLPFHTIIIMNIYTLMIEIIDIPFYLNFFLVGKVWPETPAHCLIWWLVDYGFYYTVTMLVAWSSIERHIFVFHDRWISNRRGRLFIHYLPLVSIIIYMSIFYIWVILLPPCANTFNYTAVLCGYSACYFMDPIISAYEQIVHGFLVTFIIVGFSVALLVRFLLRKRRLLQMMDWRKYRKLTVQMLSISSLFLIINLPISLLSIPYLLGVSGYLDANVLLYLDFIAYWNIFLLPFVSLNSLPDLKKRVRKLFGLRYQHQLIIGTIRTIHPITTTLR